MTTQKYEVIEVGGWWRIRKGLGSLHPVPPFRSQEDAQKRCEELNKRLEEKR